LKQVPNVEVRLAFTFVIAVELAVDKKPISAILNLEVFRLPNLEFASISLHNFIYINVWKYSQFE